MKPLALLFVLTAACAAQSFTVENVSHQQIEEQQLLDQRDDVLRQISELASSGATGEYRFDVAGEVCAELALQEASEWPTRAKVIRQADDAPCKTTVSAYKARFAWEGWDYAEADANPNGKTINVCPTCEHKTLQEGVDAAAVGDRIKIAGSFGDANTVTALWIRDNHDFDPAIGCPFYTVIEGADLPKGVRVKRTDDLPVITGGGGAGNYNPVIRMEAFRVEVKAVDAATDILTVDKPHGFGIGDELVFLQLPKRPYAWSLDGDFDHAKRYYVVSAGESTLALSEVPGGSPVDITRVPEFGSIGLRKANRPVACWKLKGFAVQTFKGANQELISLEDHSPFPETQASHNIFEHLYIHGQDNMVGPQVGLRVDGRYIAVRDSLIEEITSQGSSDSAALALRRTPGPVWVENNGLSASSINFYVGGVRPLNGLDNGEMGGIVSRNNFHWKKAEWYALEQSGPPVGLCHEGSQSKDTLANACYSCMGNAWQPALSCANWIDYTIKNLWESKGCTGCLTENLWAELSPYGDVSQLYPIVVKASGVADAARANDVIFHNVRTRFTSGTLLMAGVVGAGELIGQKTGPIVAYNILSTEVDPDLYRYERGGTANNSMQIGGNDLGVEVRHFTQVGFPSTASESILIRKPLQMDPPRTLDWLSIKDSILQIDNVFASGTSVNCPSLQIGVASGAPTFEGNLLIKPTSLNFSPCSTTTYQEASIADVGFDSAWKLAGPGANGDYRGKATDGTNPGADVVELTSGLGGTDPTLGRGSWRSQHGIAVTAVGASTARLSAPDGCTLALFTDRAHNTPKSDATAAAGGFALTGLDSLSQYWYLATCDQAVMPGRLFTSDVDAAEPPPVDEEPPPVDDDDALTDRQILREILRLLREQSRLLRGVQ